MTHIKAQFIPADTNKAGPTAISKVLPNNNANVTKVRIPPAQAYFSYPGTEEEDPAIAIPKSPKANSATASFPDRISHHFGALKFGVLTLGTLKSTAGNISVPLRDLLFLVDFAFDFGLVDLPFVAFPVRGESTLFNRSLWLRISWHVGQTAAPFLTIVLPPSAHPLM